VEPLRVSHLFTKDKAGRTDYLSVQLSLHRILGDSVVDNEQGPLALLATAPMKVLLGLQIADIATTLIFRSMGIAESNPLVDGLMEHFGTLGGLILAKAVAITIALTVGIASRPTFVRRINAVYGVFITLNTLTILNATV